MFKGFRGDTLIECENDCKAIWDIKIDEEVLTHKGRFMPVLSIQRGRYIGPAIEMKVDGDNTVKLVKNTQQVLSIKTLPCPHKLYGECTRKCRHIKDCYSRRFKRYKTEWNEIQDLVANNEVNKKRVDPIPNSLIKIRYRVSSDWIAYPRTGNRTFKITASKDSVYIYKRILTKKEVKYDDVIYNLITEDNSYVLNCGITTHC